MIDAVDELSDLLLLRYSRLPPPAATECDPDFYASHIVWLIIDCSHIIWFLHSLLWCSTTRTLYKALRISILVVEAVLLGRRDSHNPEVGRRAPRGVGRAEGRWGREESKGAARRASRRALRRERRQARERVLVERHVGEQRPPHRPPGSGARERTRCASARERQRGRRVQLSADLLSALRNSRSFFALPVLVQRFLAGSDYDTRVHK